jgi:hypothetical protein
MSEVIKVIKTPNSTLVNKSNGWGNGSSAYYYYNGKKLIDTFSDQWGLVEGDILDVTTKLPDTCINERYELKDYTLASDKIPQTLLLAEVQCDEDYEWTGRYATLQSLYERKADKVDGGFKNIEFTLEVILTLDHEIKEPQLAYDIFTKHANKPNSKITWSDVKKNSFIPSIALPEVVRHEVECSLTSKQVYDIARAHIKANINPVYAKITSDYDFCFSVKKNITLQTPYNTTVLTNLFGKGKPKEKSMFVNTREVTIFEMTHAQENYKGYTAIKCIKGENLEDLANKLDGLLHDLIEKINKPLIECAHCNGYGVKEVV